MMKKQEFLDELKRHLKVLQAEEQEDILDEYSQHIEMKIAAGLSEEEAIKDFGPVQALAGEILEAYHVNPDYDQDSLREQQSRRKRIRIAIPFADSRKDEKDRQTACSQKAMESTSGAGLRKVGVRIGDIGRNGWFWMKALFGKLLWMAGVPFRAGAYFSVKWKESRGAAAESQGTLWDEFDEAADGRMEPMRLIDEIPEIEAADVSAAEDTVDAERAAEAGEAADRESTAEAGRAMAAAERVDGAERTVDKGKTVDMKGRTVDTERTAGRRNAGIASDRKKAINSGKQQRHGVRIFGTLKRSWMGILDLTGRLIRWGLAAFFWCCRLAWNCCVLLASICSACAGLMFLFLFGILAVLWGQGYPFGGIVLGCLGGMLCFISLAVFGCTFFWRKRHE